MKTLLFLRDLREELTVNLKEHLSVNSVANKLGCDWKTANKWVDWFIEKKFRFVPVCEWHDEMLLQDFQSLKKHTEFCPIINDEELFKEYKDLEVE